MKIKRKGRSPVYVWGIFSLFFAILIVVFFLKKETELRKEIVESDQIIYAEIASRYMIENQLKPETMDSLSSLLPFFPENLHLTILDEEGAVLYDNKLFSEESEKNGKEEAEIKKALVYGEEWKLKKFEGTEYRFLYYAVYRSNYVIRTGLPLTPNVEVFLRPDFVFIGFIVFLFVLLFIPFFLTAAHYRRIYRKLMYFVWSFRKAQSSPELIPIMDNEWGEIQSNILAIYEQMEESKREILQEREKLLKHFHFAEEGISFFTSSFENIYTNSHFIHYLNRILNQSTFDVKQLFKSPIFGELVCFLERPEGKNTFVSQICIEGRCFQVCAILFDDKSFEIIIRDISEVEKNKLDVEEMTGNIAHELRTPVASVCAYLETLIEHPNLNSEKREEYTRRAYTQIVRLSTIIQDLALLSKTSLAPQLFDREEVDIYDLLQELYEVNAKEYIEKNKCTVNLLVRKGTIVKGNRTLLYAIFWNLTHNSLKYVGENSVITIQNYREDHDFYYFLFSDNGKGIDERHVDHIFERFYRVTEGRTRGKGGSGLGLSIVKESVLFHGGEIFARNKKEGGLEILFNLAKSSGE
ncbi:MAG: ATP-binding protein [Candidatus Azobacteroides sp.]|nr:ATP-binding protein [Candidatus Azobacteroides sp.]